MTFISESGIEKNSLRFPLMPKLISGELRLKNTDTFWEAPL